MSSGISKSGVSKSGVSKKGVKLVNPQPDDTRLYNKFFDNTPNPPTPDQMLVILDSKVEKYKMLAAGVLEGAKVVVLKPKLDGIQQISEALHKHPNTLSLHILSPAAPACLCLGNAQLNLKTLERYSWELQDWFPHALNPTPYSILLYGCQVGAGIDGYQFVRELHQLTGAAIAASSTATGHANHGGNWNLEVTIGSINSAIAFREETLNTYPALI